MLQVTPIEYDKCGNVVKQYPISTVRKPELGDARWRAWANVKLGMAPVVTGDMKWLHVLSGDRDYANEKPSSM
eukprot:2837566-Prymnesium_polylepis.1